MDLVIGLLTITISFLLINPLVNIFLNLWRIAMSLRKSKPIDLREKYGCWAVITGSTDGIGKEFAKELARRHMNIVLISRSIDKLNATKNELHVINSSIQVKIIQIDFSKGEEIMKDIEAGLKDIPIGILVNNVGKSTKYPMYFDEIPKKQLWEIININIGATTLMTHIVLKQMKERCKGAIVNISSAASYQPLPLASIYGASKIYINQLSDTIKAECSEYGLTIQCLTPFFIKTKMITFSDRFKNGSFLWPDAATYARSAVENLEKCNSSTGYWIHDIIRFFMLLAPKFLRTIVATRIIQIARKDYFLARKKKIVD